MLSERWKCYLRDPIFPNFPGTMPPDPPRSLLLRRSWLALAINLTFQRHCAILLVLLGLLKPIPLLVQYNFYKILKATSLVFVFILFFAFIFSIDRDCDKAKPFIKGIWNLILSNASNNFGHFRHSITQFNLHFLFASHSGGIIFN